VRTVSTLFVLCTVLCTLYFVLLRGTNEYGRQTSRLPRPKEAEYLGTTFRQHHGHN
jgi:hypothetical protein